jgi:hypothetical protein
MGVGGKIAQENARVVVAQGEMLCICRAIAAVELVCEGMSEFENDLVLGEFEIAQ